MSRPHSDTRLWISIDDIKNHQFFFITLVRMHRAYSNQVAKVAAFHHLLHQALLRGKGSTNADRAFSLYKSRSIQLFYQFKRGSGVEQIIL